MATKPPPPTRKTAPAPAAPAAPPPPAGAPRSDRTFSVRPCRQNGAGKKIIVYGKSGLGKTTLAAMSPSPVFLPLDGGVDEVGVDPRTDEPLSVVNGVETFEDVRAVLADASIFASYKTVVVDTVTFLQRMAEPYLFATVKNDRGETMRNVEQYGYGKGYVHLADVMRLVQADLDPLLRAGKNVVLLAQEQAAKMNNAEGPDSLEAGPRLGHWNNASIRNDFVEWADHVLRLTVLSKHVQLADKKDRVGKVTGGDTTRLIQAENGLAFVAKSRGTWITEPTVSFAEPDDDTLWQLFFPEEYE